MDDDVAGIERQVASDPGNLSLLKRLAQLYRRHERQHQGKTLDQWLDSFLYENCSSRERNYAKKMLVQMGPAAVPALTLALESENHEVCRRAAKIIGKYRQNASPAVSKLTELLSDDNPHIARFALQSLGLIGPESSSAIPTIIKAFGQSSEGLQALVDIDPDHELVFPYLKIAILAAPRNTRIFAAGALLKLGGQGHELLKEQLESRNERTVFAILTALARQPVPDAFLPRVMSLLETQGIENVGWYAARALKNTGKAAIPYLVRSLSNPKATSRRHALQALRNLGPASFTALSAIESCLEDPNRQVRSAALNALAAMGEKARKATPQIAQLIKSEESFNRKNALLALSKVAAREDLVSLLELSLQDPQDSVAQTARQILSELKESETSP